jgi:hypothetical protein
MATLKNEDRMHALWSSYLEAERVGLRDVMRKSLDDFVSTLLVEGRDDVDAWALDLAEQVVDGGKQIPVRTPLFRRVLCPALVRGVLGERRCCARWLANFERELIEAEREVADLPDNLRTGSGLLREALRVDPSDVKARRRLIENEARYLQYTIHELPTGVLYGHNSASIEECSELLTRLAEFCEHVQVLGERRRYEELIANCRHHFRAYRQYLTHRRPGDSYAEFLAGDRGA